VVILKVMTSFCPVIILAAMLVLIPAIAAPAPEKPLFAEEYELKAAYIFNFTKFVTWPSTAFKDESAPIKICIPRNRMLEYAFSALTQKSSQKRRIEISGYENTKDSGNCHLLFFDEPLDSSIVAKVLMSVRNSPILTIGVSRDFVTQGGIIRFVTTDGRLTFEINPEAARRAGLEISSKMLSLAKIVRDVP